MHFGNSGGNFDVSAVQRPFEHDSAAGMSKLVALLPNFMQVKVVHNWSDNDVVLLSRLPIWICNILRGSQFPVPLVLDR